MSYIPDTLVHILRDQNAKIIDSSSQGIKVLLPEKLFLSMDFSWISHNSYPQRKSMVGILRNSPYVYLK